MVGTIRTRFVEYLTSKGLSKAQGEKEAGLVRGSLSQPGEIKADKIVAIKKAFPEINLMWLMTGEGDPLEQSKSETSKDDIRTDRAIDRLCQFVRWLKEEREVIRGDASFEVMCGLSNKYLSNSRKNNRGAISTDVIARIYDKFPELSLVWLCTGKGEMIMENQGLNFDYKKAYEGAVMQISALNEIINKKT